MIEPRNDEIVSGFNSEKIKELRLDLYSVDNHDDIILINLSGYIDTYNTSFFNNRMNLVLKKYNKIIFDLAGINYVSSTGIGAFTNYLKQVKKMGGDMALINVSPRVYEVFQLLGFSTFFNIPSTMEKAISMISGQKKSDSAFPTIIVCPICGKKLRAQKEGKFRCPQCKQILVINKEAKVKIV